MIIPQSQASRPWNPSSHDILEDEAPESLSYVGKDSSLQTPSQASVSFDRETQVRDQKAPTEKPPVPDFDIE